MKTKVAILCLHLLVCAVGAKAQTMTKISGKATPVQISVQVKGKKIGNDSLTVVFWRDHVYGNMLSGSKSFNVRSDKNGKIIINLPAIDHPGRITLYDWTNGFFISTLQLIEPGDNIGIVVQSPESDTEEPTIKFSGKGAAKFECAKLLEINPISDFQALNNTELDYGKSLFSADSLIQARLKLLNQHKDKISPLAYRIISTDLKGSVYQMACSLISPNNRNTKSVEADHHQKIKEVMSELEKIANRVDTNALLLSVGYPEFLYELTKLDLAVSDNFKNYTFKQLYDKINNGYQGVVREKLLAFTFFNSRDQYTLFFGIDDYDYITCLNDAIASTQTAYLKNALQKRLNTRARGAITLNFKLAADSSGRMVKLSDLKGKVVLVDMWGYICTACYMFSQSFHEKVYPQFKDNPDFAVVSIMLSPDANKEKYMERLRGKGKYTSADYINLYAGKGEPSVDLIKDHYNIDAVPFLLVVDKDGKVFSSTPPFFTDASDTEKINALTELIKEALADKSSTAVHNTK